MPKKSLMTKCGVNGTESIPLKAIPSGLFDPFSCKSIK
jgi:hypothetical protein